MPIYEYRCEDGHDFEVFQNMTDDPVTACEVCGKPVQRVFSPVAVHYKGSGFYTTDYGSKKRPKGGEASDSSDSGSKSSGDSKSSSDSGSSSSGSGDKAKASSGSKD